MRMLVSLCDCPMDPTNGAARTMRTVAEFMAARGHQVHVVAPTATEFPCHLPGLQCTSIRGVEYSLLDVPGKSTQTWRTLQNEKGFDSLTDWILEEYDFDLLFCYGGYPSDVARFNRARRKGLKLVLGLRNYGYPVKGFFDLFDGVVTGSQFLTDWYRKKLGIESTPLPLPIQPEDVIATDHRPVYFTIVNPSPEKGKEVSRAILNRLSEVRPDIPFQIVKSGLANDLVVGNVWYREWLQSPRDYLSSTRCLLVPSLWDEPAGRVVPEALLNGIPVILSERGGLPETARGGGFVLPISKAITPNTAVVSPADVQPWVDLIIRLQDDPDAYESACFVARRAGITYRPEIVAPLYEAYFENILTPAVHFSARRGRTLQPNIQGVSC